MAAAPPISVALALEPATDPIAGTMTMAGEPQPFRGWIELVGLIESLRALEQPGPEGPAGPPDRGGRAPPHPEPSAG